MVAVVAVVAVVAMGCWLLSVLRFAHARTIVMRIGSAPDASNTAKASRLRLHEGLYGENMLTVKSDVVGLPLVCHWFAVDVRPACEGFTAAI